MNGKIKYEFTGKVWQHSGPGGWYFVSLPIDLGKEIRSLFKSEEEGWGRLKATARIGTNDWNTAIWFDAKRATYLLPLKAEIRKKARLEIDAELHVTIWI